jgi:hypothetical protein
MLSLITIDQSPKRRITTAASAYKKQAIGERLWALGKKQKVSFFVL